MWANFFGFKVLSLAAGPELVLGEFLLSPPPGSTWNNWRDFAEAVDNLNIFYFLVKKPPQWSLSSSFNNVLSRFLYSRLLTDHFTGLSAYQNPLSLSKNTLKSSFKNVAKWCQQDGTIEFLVLISIQKHQFEKLST